MPLPGTVQTGISYAPELPGLVPELEERDAARWCGYDWPAWGALAYDERARAVAYYRLSLVIDMHREDAKERELKRRTRRKK